MKHLFLSTVFSIVCSVGFLQLIDTLDPPKCIKPVDDNAIRTEAQDMASFEFGVLCGASHSVAECASIYIHKDDLK